jgi:ATP-dependent RNA helicase DeaD
MIEKATRQKIAVGTLPTVADLRQRRLELTRASLRETVLAGELDAYRNLVAELSTELDPMDVAAAAVKLAHEASHAENDAKAERRTSRSSRSRRRRPGARRHRPFANERARNAVRERDLAPGDWDRVKLFVGSRTRSRRATADLVGAIANESGVKGGAIGAIEITDRFSLVEVPAEAAETVIRALRNTTIRGRQVPRAARSRFSCDRLLRDDELAIVVLCMAALDAYRPPFGARFRRAKSRRSDRSATQSRNAKRSAVDVDGRQRESAIRRK